jgi:hypothetical protein
VLAPFRPDPQLQTDIDAIDSNDEDDDMDPTVAPWKTGSQWV